MRRYDKMITKNIKGLMKTPYAKDSDGDGVNDLMDCQPHNPRKQGIVHDIKNKIKEGMTEYKQKRAAEGIIRKKSRAAYFQEKEKADIVEARARARAESSQRIKDYKKKLSRPKDSFGSYFGGTTTTKRTTTPVSFDAVTGTWSGGEKIRSSTPKRVKRRKKKTTKRKSNKGKRKVVMYV